jgi:transketolase
VVAEAEGGPRQVTLIATGSEVGLALAARGVLAEKGIRVAVVSMPSWELFAEQGTAKREATLFGPDCTGGSVRPLRVALEMVGGFGWERWVGEDGLIITMSGFGASAPPPHLLAHFGFTPEAVASKIQEALVRRQ